MILTRSKSPSLQAFQISKTQLKTLILTFESEFCVWILANVNGLLVLAVFHIPQFVIVGVPLEQEIAHLAETIVCCVMQRSPLTHVQSINIGLVHQKVFNALVVSSLGR